MKFVFWLKLATIRLPNVSYILCAKRLWSVCCGGVFAIGVHARVNVSHSACSHSAKILGPFLNVYLLFSSFIKLSWRECNYFCKYREDYLELILSLHICLYMLMVIVYEVIHFLIIL